MRILISHYVIDDDTPPARSMRAIGGELASLGHEVLIHRSYGSAGPSGTTEPSGAPRRRLPVASLRNRLWFAKALARNVAMRTRDLRAIRDFRPDVVLARQDAYCFSMTLAARKTKVPLVMHADAPVAYESRLYNSSNRWHPPRIVEAVESLTLRGSLAVTVTSRPTAGKLAEYGLNAPFHVIPNGLHTDRFPELSGTDRERLRAEMGITAPHVAGFLGTFRAFHGIDRLREIMLATAHRSDVHWLLIGDGPERGILQAAVEGRVVATFVGRQPPEAVGRLLGLVDVAVAPHEPVRGAFYLSPLKIIECAAAGCAVVASDQGDIPWLLDDGRAGILLKDEGTEVWSRAIIRLLDDDPLRRSLGLAARQHVLGSFSWREIARQFETALLSALGRDPSNRTPSLGFGREEIGDPPPRMDDRELAGGISERQ